MQLLELLEIRDIIFSDIRKKSKRPGTISIIEHIARNLTNFELAELKDNISKG